MIEHMYWEDFCNMKAVVSIPASTCKIKGQTPPDILKYAETIDIIVHNVENTLTMAQLDDIIKNNPGSTAITAKIYMRNYEIMDNPVEQHEYCVDLERTIKTFTNCLEFVTYGVTLNFTIHNHICIEGISWN